MGDNMTDQSQSDILERLKQAEEAEQKAMRRTAQAGILSDDGRSA